MKPPETSTPNVDALLARGLASVPFAALLFRPDARLTLLWRNAAHERMSSSVGRAVAGMGMFEAFPPSADSDGSAAMAAIRETVDRIVRTGKPEDIGPYRFDLPDDSGAYAEYHWQMHFAPIREAGELVAILQVASDVTEAVLAERLARSHRRTSASTASLGYFSYDPATDLFLRHALVDAMFGFAPDEAGPNAAPFFERVHPEDIGAVHAEVARILAAPQGETASFDYRVPQSDGTERFVRIRAEMAIDPADRRPKLVGTFIDLTDIENDRKELERALKMREALVEEANHRIKNSLQIAVSMLRLEAGLLSREGGETASHAVEALRAVEARVRAVADVHGLMRIDAAMTTTDLRALLDRLVTATRDSADLAEAALRFAPGDTRLPIDSNRAVALGLMVNELLTNAIKYGAPSPAQPVALTLAGDLAAGLEIAVENAAAAVVSPIASSGLGERLVRQFAEQIGATLEKSKEAGRFRAVIRIPPDAGRDG